MLTGGTERNGEVNVDWRDRADWRRGMLTAVTERTGERNVDWSNREGWRGEC